MRLLLVENPQTSVWALKRRLEQDGFQVDSVTEDKADSQARTNSYDVLVLEFPLTRVDGPALLRGWRAAGLYTPVVVLADPIAMEERVALLDMGADGVLAKPIQVEELLARMRALLRRGNGNHRPVLRVFDLEINPDSRTVKRGGHDIRLTPREFALLQFLASHRGQVVSRPMIWEHLYDGDSPNNSNVVDVFIRYLRTKIDKGFEPRLILTRWGEGYLLRGESA